MIDHSRSRHRGVAIMVAALIVAAGASRVATLFRHVGLDSNEGWNGFQALRAMGAAPLYPAADTMIGNNYPPLSFFIVGALSEIVGDPIVAGRILALTSVAGIAVLLFLILRRLGQTTQIAICGGSLFLLLNATVMRSYLAMDDPQWFGHLLMMAALLMLLPRLGEQEPRTSRIVGAALLVVCGGLVKQNLVAWPLAMTAWLAVHHRRSLIAWLAALVVGGGIAVAFCRVEFGPDFIRNIAGVPRTYSIHRMTTHAIVPVLLTIPALIYAWPLVRLRKDDPLIDLVLLAILCAVPLGIVERSGAGVDINAHFEAALALCLACPLAAAGMRDKGRDWLGAVTVAGLLIAGLALETVEVSTMSERYRAWAAMERHIAVTPGRVACETQALCLWAGKAFEIDFFLYGERLRATGDRHLLDQALDQHRFAAIELNPRRAAAAGAVVDAPLVAMIERRMRPVFIDGQGRRLLVPRD